MLQAVGYLHGRRIVHRDVKPGPRDVIRDVIVGFSQLHLMSLVVDAKNIALQAREFPGVWKFQSA